MEEGPRYSAIRLAELATPRQVVPPPSDGPTDPISRGYYNRLANRPISARRGVHKNEESSFAQEQHEASKWARRAASYQQQVRSV